MRSIGSFRRLVFHGLVLTDTTEIGTAILPLRRPPRFRRLAASLLVAMAARRVPRAPIPVAFALAVLAVLATAAPEQAAAQTVTTAESLVSNLGQTQHSGSLPLNSWDVVQGFETGASGYTLVSVDLRLNRQSGGTSIGVPSVKLMEGTKTATSVTLTGQPVTLTAEVAEVTSTTGENYTFTAPSGTTLSASTRYFLVVERVGTRVQWMTTASTGEDAPPASAAGWSIDDERWRRSASNTGNFTGKVARSQLLRVNGNLGICARTAAVRDALLAKITGVTDCALVTATHLAAITDTLDLSEKSITALAAGDFDGLTALTYLDLESNELTALPAGVFDELTALVQLWLYNNSLTALPAGVFDELTALTTLVLEGNSLTALPAGVFDELTALEGLGLGSNSLTALPDDVFDELTALTTLVLESNSLTALPAGVFDKLTALTFLDLGDNSLTALPAAVFDELTALTILYLASNSLTALPDDVFDELTALTILGLGGNSLLTALPAGVFDELTALDALFLTGNPLTALPAGVFDALTALTELYLNNNSLAELPDDVFQELTALASLVLSGNPGAPFSPTAVALPDDGTVPAAGGTVMLDGSGSGGAWGTNVTYAWALTTPTSGVTVTFDSVSIAEPTVTIPPVTAGTDLVFTLTVTGRGGSNGISTATDTAAVTTTTNAAPTVANVIPDQTATAGTAFSYQFPTNTFNDTDTGDTLSYAATKADDTALPTWLAFTDSTRTFAGTPAVADTGTVSVKVTASDGNGGSISDEFDITVRDPNAGICARTEAVRDALLARIAGVTDCALVTDTHLAAITGTLDLETKSITALAAGDFDGLTALTTLILEGNSVIPGGNDLTVLPAGVFDELTALTTLNLRNNSLTALPAGVFDKLTALTDLDLSFSDLTALPAGVFDELTALTVLVLEGNSLTALPAGVFDELTALTVLVLEGNSLTALPAGVFDELTALTELNLFQNVLTALPAAVFDDLTALTTLILSENLLTGLPDDVFDQLTALTILYLNNNSLAALPDDVFDSLTALDQLFLSDNSLAELPDDVFQELTALASLVLSGNPGAPFSPTAVALPDDGTVPAAGGTVMLDGSGSGGAWGTNVTYSWALTTPTTGVTVTFDNDSIAKPTVTIPQVTAGTDLVFTLTVTGRGGSDGISTSTDTAKVTVNTVPGAPTSLSATASGSTTDQPLLERPGQHRRLRHHRLQDRGLAQWHLQLDQPRRQHQQHHHHLRPHRAGRRHHAPLPRLGHQLGRHRPPLQHRRRHHRRRQHRARRPDRPHGNGQREHHDQPLLDRAGQHRRLRHHRLQDRGLAQWHLELDRPRRQHRQHHHHLRAHRAGRRHHPPLPRLGHQLGRHRPPLQRRRRHHRRRQHRARRPDRPHGNGQREHHDQPLLDRAGQHRRLRHHRLQDRGLAQWHLELDRPGRQHRQHHHHLRAHRAGRQHHPPLPRLGHQLGRHRPPLQRRRRHHRHRHQHLAGAASELGCRRQRRRGHPELAGACEQRWIGDRPLRGPPCGGHLGAGEHGLAIRRAEPEPHDFRAHKRAGLHVPGARGEQLDPGHRPAGGGAGHADVGRRAATRVHPAALAPDRCGGRRQRRVDGFP